MRGSAEERLLLRTAAVTGSDDGIRAAVAEVVDWNRFHGLAQVERAIAVIHPRLRSIAADLIPSQVLDQMRRVALVSDFAMLHLESRLRESLDGLERANVRVMLLKGAGLAYSVYGDVRKRPMSDIDILVDPSAAQTTRRVLLDVGWCELSGGVSNLVYDQHQHSSPLRDTRSPDLVLEIHTALFPKRQPFDFGADELWSRGRPLTEGAGRGAFAPHPVHSLLHACLHFVWSHEARFGVWRTIRDVDAISRDADMDWEAFVMAAQKARGGTSCYWALRIAREAGGVDVPRDVMDTLRPDRSPHLLRAIERHFLANIFPAAGGRCPSQTLAQVLWELGVMPRRSGHGDIRPWDSDEEFILPGETRDTPRRSFRAERLMRVLASPGYVRSLLRVR